MFHFFKSAPAQNPGDQIPQKQQSLESLWRLLKILMTNLNFDDVVYKVVNSLLEELGYLQSGYRIVVLSLIDEKAGGLRRIALSQTQEAQRAVAVSTIPFEKIVIPFSATSNYCIKVLTEKKPLVTTNWVDLLSPPLTPEAALTNQRSAGIKTSMVYPVFSGGKPIGTLIFSMVKDYKDVTDEEKDLLAGFTDLVGLAVQNSMLYTGLQKTGLELVQANEKLKELDHLKDDFVSVASHELRTPMTAIRSYVWMALHKPDMPLTEKLKRYLYRTLVSTERLINLVNDMLNVSRIEAGKIEVYPKPFDIIALVKDVLEEVKVKADEKMVRLQVLEQKIPLVFADPDKVHQVLLNFVGNSLKFTPPDGIISIGFFTDGNMVEISVKDTGTGITKDDLAKLFHKFSRLDNSYLSMGTSGGTGLGLFISKSLIDLMHGKVWATSEGQNKGSTFTFSLPIATQELIAQAEKYHIKPQGEVKVLEPVSI